MIWLRRALSLAACAAWAGSLAGPASAGVVLQPTNALTTSFFGADGVGPLNLIDGSGLSGAGGVETQVHDAHPLAVRREAAVRLLRAEAAWEAPSASPRWSRVRPRPSTWAAPSRWKGPGSGTTTRRASPAAA